MQMQASAGYAGGRIPNPYMVYGAPVGFRSSILCASPGPVGR